MTTTTSPPSSTAIREAIAAVDDPELPGVSIVELGLLEELSVDSSGDVDVGLIPTFTGCPALSLIGDDVRRAVEAVPGVRSARVSFLTAPTWTVDRVSPAARSRLRDDLGVAVESEGAAECPRCGGTTRVQSMFGPTRCRAVHICTACAETVEVMR